MMLKLQDTVGQEEYILLVDTTLKLAQGDVCLYVVVALCCKVLPT